MESVSDIVIDRLIGPVDFIKRNATKDVFFDNFQKLS